MALIEKAKCKIDQITSQGLGSGKTDMGLVELPYLLPGDEVEFERHAYRSKSNCLYLSHKEGSYKRAKPDCEYFGICGGCLLQHFTQEDYDKLKLDMVRKPLDELGIEGFKLNNTITIPAGNRRRANIEAIKRGDDLYFGFHKYKSHRIQNIDHCIAMEQALSKVLKPLRDTIYNILDHREKAQLFLTQADNGIDIFLEIQNKKELEQNKRKLLEEFAKANGIIRLTFRYRKILDVIYEEQMPYIEFDKIRIEIDAYCFLQASKESDKILRDFVLQYATGSKVVDLFCGRGTYTLPLSKNHSVHGYESDKNALTALGRAIEDTDRDITLHRRDLFSSPLQKSELEEFDYYVINPPRAGAEEQIKELSKLKKATICYISCNPETFARDAKILMDSGFVLKEVTPVDQFYWASHMELVAILVLNGD